MFLCFWFQPYYEISCFLSWVTLSQYVYHLVYHIWIFHIKNYFFHPILNIDLVFLTQLFTICTTSDHLIIKQKNLNFREKGEEGRSISKKNKEHLPQNRTAKIFLLYFFRCLPPFVSSFVRQPSWSVVSDKLLFNFFKLNFSQKPQVFYFASDLSTQKH